MSALDRLLAATDVYTSHMNDDDEDDSQFIVRGQPESIVNCEMRNYQIEGLDWLAQLVRHGFNGILADEMGLGKTLQSISLIALARERGWKEGLLPHLIVVPKTTIDNWTKEFTKFAPNFKCVVLIGTAEERAETIASTEPMDVLITSFDICRIEISFLKKKTFGFFILDEAHRIKNEESILSSVVRTIKAERTFLLTGTPLQNNLHELWAILNFIMPRVFDNPADFDEIFQQITLEDQDSVASILHRILRPFMLRRLKSDVARDLPGKKELYVYVPLSELQRKIYKEIILRNADSVLNVNNLVGKTRLVNTLMQLRKCCNHPYLFPGVESGPPFLDGDHLIENSGKLTILDKLIERVLSDDSSNQILIFSQMTKLLDILDDYCRYRKIPHCRIDGSTVISDRVSQIDEFSKQGSEKKIFLLSTRAGGLGINLVSANFVIIFDADFNPQSDLQAIDRAHRIGQRRPVTVYRFVTRNTVEEKIVEKAAKKLLIDKMVIQKSRASDVSKDEIGEMLKFGVSELFSTNSNSSDSLDALLAFAELKTVELTKELKDEFVLKFDNKKDLLPEEVIRAAETAAATEQVVFEEIGPRERKPVIVVPAKRVQPVLKTRLAEWRAKVGGGHEYQFFSDSRLDFLEKKNSLTSKEKTEQTRLLAEGFPHWSKRNFQTVVRMLEEFGSGDETIEKICAALPERKADDIRRYIDVLFRSGHIFLGESFMARFMTRVKRVEKTNDLIDRQMEILLKKVKSCDNPWTELPGSTVDRVILTGLAMYGYGDWSALKQLIRLHPELSMDFVLQQESKDDIKVRADTLLKGMSAKSAKK